MFLLSGLEFQDLVKELLPYSPSIQARQQYHRGWNIREGEYNGSRAGDG
jgi:hypothetical protein